MRVVRGALRRFTGLQLRGVTGRFVRADDGSLVGSRTGKIRRPGDPPIDVRTVTRMAGVRIDAGVPPTLPDEPGGVPVCPDPVRLRCR